MKFKWERINYDEDNSYMFPHDVFRAQIIGGWLVMVSLSGDEEWDNKKISTTFIPDPSWEWDLS